MTRFRVDSRNGSSEVVLSAFGEIDIATAWELERAVDDALEGPAERLVLDLRGVEFMDASGAALLLRQELHAQVVARDFLVVRGPRAVQRVLELTGLTERLTIVDELPVSVG